MNPPMPEGMPPHWNVYFNVEDVDATVAKAEELGGAGRGAGVRRAGCRPDGVLADPQGAMFNLMAGDTEQRRHRRRAGSAGAERVGGVDPEHLHLGGEERQLLERALTGRSSGCPSTSARNWVAVNSPPTM